MRDLTIGKNHSIGEYVLLGIQPKEPSDKLQIGNNATIRSHTVIYGGSKIGHNLQTGFKGFSQSL